MDARSTDPYLTVTVLPVDDDESATAVADTLLAAGETLDSAQVACELVTARWTTPDAATAREPHDAIRPVLIDSRYRDALGDRGDRRRRVSLRGTALNAVIRRSRGEFIVVLAAGELLPARLAAEARERRIAPGVLGASPVVLDRASWWRIRGVNEIDRRPSLNLLHNLAIKAASSGIELQSTASAAAAAAAGGESFVIYQNDATWGLGLAPQHAHADGSTRLAFSWDAVPPLAPLRHVVLPAARPASAAEEDIQR